MKRMARREFIAAGLAGGAYALLDRTLPMIQAAEAGGTANSDRPNVLFIAVDDLRPTIGCYGVPVIQTPNIDRIAARGTVFNRAYCQQAVCSPSRTSLMLGLRPDTTKVYDLQTHFRLNLPDVVTLPQHFKQQDYHAQGLSKIYHGGLDDPSSWSVPHWRPNKPGYYPPERLSLADNPFPPKDCPDIALMNFGELRAYVDINKTGPVPDDKALELIRGYLAATSYTDAQIGRILDELERLGLRDNTVIVLWGDHGWQLGEHGLWCKHTNFEMAARAPLIFSAPGQKHAGARTDALAEFVDIYPTLCDLCGIPIPEGLHGISVAPVMNDPNRPWKKAAFSQYPRGKSMGYSMRTDRYRYTEWLDEARKQVAVELYDHENDPDENVNIALRPESKALVQKLSEMLHAGWEAALPAGQRPSG